MAEDDQEMRKLQHLIQSEARAEENRNITSVLENFLTQLKDINKAQDEEIETLTQVDIKKQEELVQLELDNKKLANSLKHIQATAAERNAALDEERILKEMFAPGIKDEQAIIARITDTFQAKLQELQRTFDDLEEENARLDEELAAEANMQRIQTETHEISMWKKTEETGEANKISDSQRETLQQLEEEGRQLKIMLQEKETVQRVTMEKNEALQEELKQKQHQFELEMQECTVKQSEIEAELRNIDEKLISMQHSSEEINALNIKQSEELSALLAKKQGIEDGWRVLQNFPALPQKINRLNSLKDDLAIKHKSLSTLKAENGDLQTCLLQTEQRARACQLEAASTPPEEEQLNVVTAQVHQAREEIKTIEAKIAELAAKEEQGQVEQQRALAAQLALEEQRLACAVVLRDLRTKFDAKHLEYQAAKETYKHNHSECTILKRRIAEQEAASKKAVKAKTKAMAPSSTVSAAVREEERQSLNPLEDTTDSSQFSQRTFDGVAVQRFDVSRFKAAVSKK